MVFGLFRRRSTEAEHNVYCEIVAQARQPAFYTDFMVPDTIDGRFDLIVLHAVLYFRRMRGEGAKVSEFAQAVFLLALPLSLVGALSLSTARLIQVEESSGDVLRKRLMRHRFYTQLIGMVAIFVTALWGMFQNLSIGPLGG